MDRQTVNCWTPLQLQNRGKQRSKNTQTSQSTTKNPSGSWRFSLLESSLAVLALISDPSLIAHARPVDTFPGWTALVARFGRGSVREEDQVKEHIQQQVSVQPSQLAASAYFWSIDWLFDLVSPPRIHFQNGINSLVFVLFFTSRSSRPIKAPGPFGVWCGKVGSFGFSQCVGCTEKNPGYSSTFKHS